LNTASKASKHVSTSIVVASPDPQSLGPSAFLVEAEVTLENIERDPNAPETAAEGDIHSNGRVL
jgi:hypothetical protein